MRRSLVALVVLCGCSSEPAPTPAPTDTGADTNTVVDSTPPDTMVPDTTTSDSGVVPDADAAVADATDAAAADADSDTGVSCSFVYECVGATEPDKSQLCGRVFDAETSGRVLGADAAGLAITVYDALTLISSGPSTATPLGTITLDECGRFSATVSRAGSGTFILALDDKSGGTDVNVISGVTAAVAAKADGLRMFAVRKATDAKWSTAAGITSTFATRGALMLMYVDETKPPVTPFGGTPAAGVTVAREGSPDATRDWYFSDATSLSRATVDPAKSATGANGTALFLESSFGGHSGTGGAPTSCAWSLANTASVPGVILIHEVKSKC